MRLGTILAIAERDLRSELKGRHGRGLVVLTLGLLLPVALVGSPASGPDPLPVRGDVPEAVLALDGVYRDDQRGTGFRHLEGALQVWAYRVPEPIREVLDAGEPVVRVQEVFPPTRIPGRTLLLALVSASTLTAAVSTSIGGERAHHTLQALLSAAVTRLEIVAGKWLAWTGFGAVSALIASLATVLAGRHEAGLWLAALPLVPGLTVALGLWIVRRTEDVIAGTTVSLRVMPAVLGGSGLLAWMLSFWSDAAAALVPLGGALLVAGDFWVDAPVYTGLALLSSAVTTVALLIGTARQLDERPARPSPHRVRPLVALTDGLPVAGLWWSLVPGPVLWGWAGNPGQTELLTVERGLFAGLMVLLVTTAVRFARATDVSQLPRVGRLHWSVLPAALAVCLAGLVPAQTSTNPWIAEGLQRLHLGLVPGPLLLLPLIVAQEIWFRGWLQSRAGLVASTIAWTVTVCPGNPLVGLVSGLALGLSARHGVLPALVARLLGVVGASLLGPL